MKTVLRMRVLMCRTCDIEVEWNSKTITKF